MTHETEIPHSGRGRPVFIRIKESLSASFLCVTYSMWAQTGQLIVFECLLHIRCCVMCSQVCRALVHTEFSLCNTFPSLLPCDSCPSAKHIHLFVLKLFPPLHPPRSLSHFWFLHCSWRMAVHLQGDPLWTWTGLPEQRACFAFWTLSFLLCALNRQFTLNWVVWFNLCRLFAFPASIWKHRWWGPWTKHLLPSGPIKGFGRFRLRNNIALRRYVFIFSFSNYEGSHKISGQICKDTPYGTA